MKGVKACVAHFNHEKPQSILVVIPGGEQCGFGLLHDDALELAALRICEQQLKRGGQLTIGPNGFRTSVAQKGLKAALRGEVMHWIFRVDLIR